MDQAITSLIDPTRGIVSTCPRCGKPKKEESTSGHICECDQICVQGVAFTRDASMQYSCKICATMVPIVLVRAHAQRHLKPKPRYEEEERNNVNGLEVGKVRGDMSTNDGGESSRKKTQVEEDYVPQAHIEVRTLNVPEVDIRGQGEPIIPVGRMREGEKKRKGGEILYCLKKVRKVQVCLERTMAVHLRGLFILKKKAFRKLLKLVSL